MQYTSMPKRLQFRQANKQEGKEFRREENNIVFDVTEAPSQIEVPPNMQSKNGYMCKS